MNKFFTTTTTQKLALFKTGQKTGLSSNIPLMRGRRPPPPPSSIQKNINTNNNTATTSSKDRGRNSCSIQVYTRNHSTSYSPTPLSTSQANICGYACACVYPHTRIYGSVHTVCVRSFYSATPTRHNQQSNNGNGYDNGNNNNNSKNSNNDDDSHSHSDSDDILNKTTPLSDVSPSDLQLAIEATGTTIDKANQQQQEQLLNSINLDKIPGTSKGGSRKLAIIYTCNVCNTRSAKKFTERAYNHGVVLVRCPNCESLHLIADRLGYFTDDDDSGSDSAGGDKKGWDIEMFMERIGQQDNIKVVTGGESNDVLEVVTVEDIVGKSTMDSIDINPDKGSNPSTIVDKSPKEDDSDNSTNNNEK